MMTTMKTRQEIKALARDAMSEQRGTAILLGFVYLAVSFVFGLVTSGIGGIGAVIGVTWLYHVVNLGGSLVITVMGINLLGEYIKIYKRQQADVGAMFSELSVNFLRKLGGSLLLGLVGALFVGVAAGLSVAVGNIAYLLVLLAIPVSLRLYFTMNILADCPEVRAHEALGCSMKITSGHSWAIFVFLLSWIGWFLLCIPTFGILYLVYVGPYWYTADAGFYLEMRDEAIANGRITRKELGLPEEDFINEDNNSGGGWNNNPRGGSGWDDYSRRN